MDHNLGANIRIYRKNKGFTQEELANMLGVTPQADSLYDEGDRWGSSLRICDYLCEESTKNPTNYEIQIEYVQQIANLSMLVDLEGFLKDEPQRYQKLYDDGIRKGIQVIRYCNNHQLVDKAHYALAWIYIHMKDYDNAREHINVLPSLTSNRVKESINMELTFFEKGFEDMKDVIVENSKILFDVLGKHLYVISQNYAWFGEKEEALRICDWSEQLLNLYTQKDGFFEAKSYYGFRKWITVHKMVAYSRAGEKDNAEKVYKDFLDEMKQRNDLSEEEYQEIIYFLDCQKKWI